MMRRAAGSVVAALFLLTTCIGSGFAYFVVPYAPAGAARGFLLDVRGGDFERALQRTSARYRSEHDASALERAVRSMPSLHAHRSVALTQGSVDGDHAVLDGTLETANGSDAIAVELTRDQNYWYVDAVIVRGRPLE